MAYHPQAFNALVTARQQARASRKSLALCSLCRYCRSPCSGHPTKHAAECPVIILVRCTALLLATGAHNSLDSTVQDGSVRAGHPGGATGGSSRFHGAALKGQSFGRTQGYPTPNPNQDWYPEDWDISDPTPASKFPRPDQKGGQPLQHGKGGKGRGQQNRQDPRGSKRGVPPRGPLQQHQGNAPPPKTASCSIQMATVLLRHEDQMAILRQSTGMVAFMGTAPPLTVLPLLHKIGGTVENHEAKRPGGAQASDPAGALSGLDCGAQSQSAQAARWKVRQ